MRRLARLCAVVALVALGAETAAATSIVLSSSASRAPGDFRVDMWLDDSTRDSDVLELQFDIDLPPTGPGSLAALEPFLLPNTQRASSEGDPLIDGGGDLGPFDLYEFIGNPAGSIDVRVVLASSDAFAINGLAVQWSAFPVCTGTACFPQQLGLAQNRLYLGSFYIFLPDGELGDGPPVVVRVPANSIFTSGGDPYRLDPLQLELRASAGMLRIEGLAPEPASSALLALALAAVSRVRARCFA